CAILSLSLFSTLISTLFPYTTLFRSRCETRYVYDVCALDFYFCLIMDWENARVFLDCKFSDKCYGISVCLGCICRASECEFAPYMWNNCSTFYNYFFITYKWME